MTSCTIGEANATIGSDRRFQSRPRRKPVLSGKHELGISQTWCGSAPEALHRARFTCLRCSQQVFRLPFQLVQVSSLRERTSRVSSGIHGCLLHRLRPATRQRDCRWHQCDGLDSVLSAGPEAHPSAPGNHTPSHSRGYPDTAAPSRLSPTAGLLSMSSPGIPHARTAYGGAMPKYVPRVSAERVEQLRRWHEDVSSELHARPTADIEYLGLQLRVPQGVFAPTPTSDLLGNLVTDHAAPGLRVLDMGCGAGANAVLAARTGATVLGVDVNPAAVEASRANAARNGVADGTDFAVSDLFDAVEGDFDLVVIDPPFRWFSPRTMLERAFTDENYATLTAFLR